MAAPDAHGDTLVKSMAFRANVDSTGMSDQEAADMAMAKALQEQERNFAILAGGVSSGPAIHEADTSWLGQDFQGDSGGSSEETDDEKFARELEQEERRRYLLIMAGYDPDAMEEEGEDLSPDDEDTDPDGMGYEELTAVCDVVGTVSRGIPEQDIAALPTVKFAKHSAERCGGAAALDKCMICQFEYEGEDELKVLPCEHGYHTECVVPWLRENKKCPVCSTEVCSTGAQAAAPRSPAPLQHSPARACPV